MISKRPNISGKLEVGDYVRDNFLREVGYIQKFKGDFALVARTDSFWVYKEWDFKVKDLILIEKGNGTKRLNK